MGLQQRYEILSSAMVGIEFEFFTELSPKELTKSLSAALGKKITIPVTVRELDVESKLKYHSDLEPTATLFKIERDHTGGKDMYELITGPLVYEEARIIIIKMNQWICDTGWTTDHASLHLNVSFDRFKVRLREPLINLNVLKFILGFDEEFIYSRFPVRRDSVYAKSIYNFYPINKFVFYERPEHIDRREFVVPNEKYYGVNFTKLIKGYVEMRYIGGQGYEKKTFKILEILEYLITKLYNCLQNGDSYTVLEKDRLYKTLSSQKKVSQTFSDTEKFLLLYPDIQVTVDMKGDVEILKAYWLTLREMLFSLIAQSGLKKGHLNFDTDVSTFQLRDGVLKKANHVDRLEMFDCVVSGTFTNCDFYRCKIKSSRVEMCKLIEENEVEGSKINHTSVLQNNLLTDCYIENPNEVIDGKVNAGVIRRGIIGKNAIISKQTLIVNAVGEGEKKDFDSYHDAFSKK